MNRHDYNPKNGRVVAKEEIEKDIILMKQFNVNAIRTCHYPDSYYADSLPSDHIRMDGWFLSRSIMRTMRDTYAVSQDGSLAHRMDPSRLVHYEGDFDMEYADVYSTMYTWLENPAKPFLMKDIIEKSRHPHIL